MQYIIGSFILLYSSPEALSSLPWAMAKGTGTDTHVPADCRLGGVLSDHILAVMSFQMLRFLKAVSVPSNGSGRIGVNRGGGNSY
jgi:hypothetical protein